jgi:endonuclease YncB( thermonuclease family)
MNIIRLLVCAALICSCALADAEEFSGKVIAVIDGDTLLVLRDGHPVKVRLAEIDAPEKAQPFGMASQKSLAEMTKGKQVQVESRAVDDYGRLVAMIRAGEVNVNHEQVRRGAAWEYSRYHSNHELMALQREAQRARRGLWAEEGAIEPSQWRKQHPNAMTAKPPTAVAPASAPAAATPSGQNCSKKHCSEMNSCEEAIHYFTVCGKKSLDGDADGIPCEKLCADAKSKTGSAQ